MIFSHSRISTFEQCPQKFRFQYIDRAEIEEVEGVEAFLGSRVHEALEKLYKDLKFQKIIPLPALLRFYREQWKKNWHDNVQIVREEYSERNYKKMGEKFIADFYNRYKPFDKDRTIGLEQRITVEIGGYKITGFIDRLSFCNGAYEIHDYKTAASLPEQAKLDIDRQLALYALAVKKMFRDAKKIDLVWHFLAFDKEMRSERTDKQLKELENDVLSSIQAIELACDTEKFPAKESVLCDWCEFRAICSKWGHIIKTDAMPANRFLKEPGVQLVNKYSVLYYKKKEFLEKIDEELEELREAIFQFAKKEGVERIAGSDFVAKVTMDEKVKWPGKSDEERRELEEIIKKAGKWNDVSTLDVYALAKAAQAWPEGMQSKIKRFQELVEERRIYLSGRKEK
jgi:putative RecB family exonuclease